MIIENECLLKTNQTFIFITLDRMKTQVELLKESCDIKDAACVRYQKRIAELEEENKKLKEELEIATKCSSQEEWKLRNLEKENKELREENEELKERIEALELCIDVD